MTVTDDSIRSY